MNIDCKEIKKGFCIKYRNKRYNVIYPVDVWKNYPRQSKEVLLDNLNFLITSHILMWKEKKIVYNTSFPLLKSFFYEANINSLPFCADIDDVPVADYLKKFMNENFKFRDYNSKQPYFSAKVDGNAVVNFTFGKDSLLTHAVCQEIGINTTLVFVEGPDFINKYENKHKRNMVKKFKKETGVTVFMFPNETELLHDYDHMKVERTEVGWGHQLTEYTLEMLPFAHRYNAKYIMFGNEHSCSASYINDEGFISYPVYDQTHEWTIQLNNISRIMSQNKVLTTSIVEPLDDLAIIKILHNRYKKLAKYQMSCTASNSNGKTHHWCGACSKCARIYILMRAVGVEPKKLKLKNMLDKKSKSQYSIFGGGGEMCYFDEAGVGKDEQMYAFYLAYKNGAKGYLMDKFKKKYLKEVKAREDEFYKRFFAVHPSITIPHELKNKIIHIYKEELAK